MSYIINFFRGLFNDEDGQTLSEYGLIIALVVVVVIAALMLLGDNLIAIFNQIAGAI